MLLTTTNDHKVRRKKCILGCFKIWEECFKLIFVRWVEDIRALSLDLCLVKPLQVIGTDVSSFKWGWKWINLVPLKNHTQVSRTSAVDKIIFTRYFAFLLHSVCMEILKPGINKKKKRLSHIIWTFFIPEYATEDNLFW